MRLVLVGKKVQAEGAKDQKPIDISWKFIILSFIDFSWQPSKWHENSDTDSNT